MSSKNLVFLIFSFTLLFSPRIHSQCDHPDYAALMEIFDALDGWNWAHSNNAGWKDGKNGTSCEPCEWANVFCDNNRVVTLNLFDENLSGPFPDIKLDSLGFLRIRNLSINEAFPDLSGVPQIQYLEFKNCVFNVPLTNFSHLAKLQKFRVESCTFQDFPELDQLDKLEEFYLFKVTVRDSMRDVLKLKNLKVFRISYCELIGSIPNFCCLPKLEELSLRHNTLSSTIPDFCCMPNLKEFTIERSDISGSLPNFCCFPNLERIEISVTGLSGEIPDFCCIEKLESLYLHENELSGSISDFCCMPNLKWFNFSSNSLSGKLPDFCCMPNLISIQYSNNAISGQIPDFCCTPELENIFGSRNELVGPIPNFTNVDSLKYLFLGHNNLIGPLPNLSQLEYLETLDASNNKIDGTMPQQLAGNKLTRIILPTNKLSGLIPDYGNYPNLAALDLYQNNLMGCFPEFVCGLSYFRATENDILFNGGAHNAFCYDPSASQVGGSCGGLEYFGVGVIQEDCSCLIEECQSEDPEFESLMKFYLDLDGENWINNNGWRQAAKGVICDPCINHPLFGSWYGITCSDSGQIIGIDMDGVVDNELRNLEGNNLSGTLPELNLPYLKTLSLTGNTISGPLPEFQTLENIERLGLAFNNFTGPLPDFANNIKLQEFRGSYNEFTGQLPDLSPFQDLNTFTASNNFLEGCFPQDACNYTVFSVKENKAMAWEGDHENYCLGQSEIGAPCINSQGLEGTIDSECSCSLSSSTNNFDQSEPKLYPNPVNVSLSIISEERFDSYQIFDITGQLILDGPLLNNEINSQALSAGVYFISLQTATKKATIKRFIKI